MALGNNVAASIAIMTCYITAETKTLLPVSAVLSNLTPCLLRPLEYCLIPWESSTLLDTPLGLSPCVRESCISNDMIHQGSVIWNYIFYETVQNYPSVAVCLEVFALTSKGTDLLNSSSRTNCLSSSKAVIFVVLSHL